MENNNKFRELYSIYLELGHEVFEEKIKKQMELCLQADSNVISMNALDTTIASVMEKSKLGEAGFDEHDIFSSPSTEEKIYFDDTMPPIYDNYHDDCFFSVHLLLRRTMITTFLLYLMIMVMRIIMISI